LGCLNQCQSSPAKDQTASLSSLEARKATFLLALILIAPPQPRINSLKHHCALSPASPSNNQRASTDLSEELPQNGDVPMSPLSSIGGLGAIGGHNSNLKIDLSFAGAVGTADRHVHNPDCART
jgi:hypothetical protein